MKLLERRRMILFGLPIALVIASGVAVQAATPPARACSIDVMAAEYGLAVTATTNIAIAASQVQASIAKAEPGSTISDQQVAKIASQQLPVVNGREAVVALLSGVRVDGIGSPIGFDPGPMRAACVMTIYDAKTGEFLATLKDLEVVQ